MFGLFRRDPLRQSVQNFYVELANAARNPVFFAKCAVPDTFEGRFEMLILHVALVQARLKSFADDGAKEAQLLTDCLFADLDAAVREAGVSDVGVPRKMKVLAEAYFGRLTAYDAALRGERDMTAAIARNVLAANTTDEQPQGAVALARYVAAVAHVLAQKDVAAILALRRQDLNALAAEAR